MPRVLWFSVQLLCLLLNCLWNHCVDADCWYNNARYQEGREVSTVEPCLNCTCLKATLVCYLRVCPKLPNPPPLGCILLYKYQTCCPELICQDTPANSYYIEARSETNGFDLIDRTYIDNACIVNGTVYAPGSAMDSSTFCEYCYCLGGKQRCVKPKCLLPIEGCTPVYSSESCCPVHYKCVESSVKVSTTTSPEFLQDSCLVAGKFYPKGHKILGVGHSACDNCYCIRGLVRCEPLSCAPPLLGCLPVVKPGECCAASYNCSGTIETRPEPNYGNFPIVSKEYAKFRKEATRDNADNTVSTTKTHRISGYYGTTRHFVGNALDRSTAKPYDNLKSTTIYPNTEYKFDSDENNFPIKSMMNDNTTDADGFLEGRINRKVGNTSAVISNFTDTDEFISTTEFNFLDDFTTEVANQTDSTEDDVTMLASTIFNLFTHEFFKDTSDIDATNAVTNEVTTDMSTTMETTTAGNTDPITVKTVTNTTDCVEQIRPESSPFTNDNKATNQIAKNSSKNGNASVENDVTIVDLESKVKVSTLTVRPLEKLAPNILTFNKDKEDYDYDVQPTLPPSLPNLKIIPFLPSDALDAKKKTHEKKRFPLLDERVTDSNLYTFTNLFSPPMETEGGFVPKDPPLLENFYENYHATGIEANAVTSITISPITKRTKIKEDSCLSEGLEIPHGEAVTSKNVCVVCLCYYGDIICQDPQCPALKKGCRKSNVLDRSTCCPHILCDDESPQNINLDHLEITSNSKDVVTVAEGIVSQDPFKDVIRTEPAPNLQTLIGDMPEFFRKKTQNATFNSSSNIQENTTKKSTMVSEELSLDKVLQLLFSGDNEEKTTITTVTTLETSTEASNNNNELTEQETEYEIKPNENSGVGLLKLAGCNIYGRMYRVGRIISELSGPCLECKCTEIGVQCQKLC